MAKRRAPPKPAAKRIAPLRMRWRRDVTAADPPGAGKIRPKACFFRNACERFHRPGLVSARNIVLRFGVQHFAGDFTMAIAEHTAFQSHLPIRSYDRWILLGYVAFAILAIVAIYFASTQPGFTEADLLRTVALP